jgi:hypothetical protein
MRPSATSAGELISDHWPPADHHAWRRVRNTIGLAVAIGIGLVVILAIVGYVVEPMFPKPRRPLATPRPGRGSWRPPAQASRLTLACNGLEDA